MYGILHFLSGSVQELRYGKILARVGIPTVDGAGHCGWELERTRNVNISDGATAGGIVVQVCLKPQ